MRRRRKMTQERVDAYLRREAWLNDLDKNNKTKARKKKREGVTPGAGNKRG